jgi:phosphoribosylaminoimidazole-succinocarboxamide synthase
MSSTVVETSLSDLTLARRGKVRDVYTVDDGHLAIVATDRISAFDCVLPTPIPRKGEILTALSAFWFERLARLSPHHLITTNLDEMPAALRRHADALRGRTMFVRRAEVFPVECVVRGYLAGSGWKDYRQTGAVCGHRLPAGLPEAARLPEPLFTPATKAESGHDINISEAQMEQIVGAEATKILRETSLALYLAAQEHAFACGIIIADTKFEFGRTSQGEIILVDEALTPDSSRFWSAATYRTGISPPSFDKQFVRDYLETLDWDKSPPAPALPRDIAQATTERYLEAYRLLTGREI